MKFSLLRISQPRLVVLFLYKPGSSFLMHAKFRLKGFEIVASTYPDSLGNEHADVNEECYLRKAACHKILQPSNLQQLMAL